jgi:hypothetical protein
VVRHGLATMGRPSAPSTAAGVVKRPPVGGGAKNAAKTHCPRGHEYRGWNVMWRPTGGRRCRTCHDEASTIRRALRRF